jgi:hypothetical protein
MTGQIANSIPMDDQVSKEDEPSSLFGLDPLFWTHVPLFVRDVLSLRRCGRAQVFSWTPFHATDKNNESLNSHFLRLVQVSGIVVGREDLTKCIRFLCMLLFLSCAYACLTMYAYIYVYKWTMDQALFNALFLQSTLPTRCNKQVLK